MSPLKVFHNQSPRKQLLLGNQNLDKKSTDKIEFSTNIPLEKKKNNTNTNNKKKHVGIDRRRGPHGNILVFLCQ